ncbi:MAG: glycosyltransferase [PVC group bacterium]
MIFVTIGASEFQFNRMLRWVDRALEDLSIPREEIFFQVGCSSYRPRTGESVDYIDFHGMEERIKKANIVICHAGVGTILISLVNGKKPIVIPRREEYAETVDNHQVIFASHLAANNLVVYPLNNRDLKEAITATPAPVERVGRLTSSDQSRDRLISYLDAWVKEKAGG